VTLVTHSGRPRKRTATERVRSKPAVRIEDPNLAAAALLYDMAALQPTERSQLGYKRAARAVVALPVSVGDLVTAGSLRDIPYVGPASSRVITEFVEQGHSPTVEQALATSSKRSQVVAKQQFRANFLSAYAMQQALALDLGPAIVSKGHVRGDFQMHTVWSDGGESIASMAEGAMDLGHSCLGVTDHSYGLPIARGMTMETVARQQQEIDALNAEYGSRFRVFKGVEANILADGTLDLQPDERDRFEFIVASAHSLLRRDEDQTARMLGAVNGRGVTILGHPRGRMFNSRPGVTAEWRRVFEAAAQRHVAIELDGDWHRQDIDFELAREALDAGCIFALDSDAHAVEELRFTDFAIAHARLAQIPAERVINCWSNEELEEWMEERRRRN
jgi:histidinol phosphatase-like PHP family hydrolase